MKNFIKILIIIGISPILSEEYVCSNDLSEFNQSGVEIKAYQRSSEEGFFIRHLKIYTIKVFLKPNYTFISHNLIF